METILTCQRLSAGYSNPELRPGDAVLFRTFDYWTQPDYGIDPIMMSLDEHVIYQVFSTEEKKSQYASTMPSSTGSYHQQSYENIPLPSQFN